MKLTIDDTIDKLTIDDTIDKFLSSLHFIYL